MAPLTPGKSELQVNDISICCLQLLLVRCYPLFGRNRSTLLWQYLPSVERRLYMKFGKRIRKELSPSLLRGSIDYKALKRIAKTTRLLEQQLLDNSDGGGSGGSNTGTNDKIDEFLARLEVEREKVRLTAVSLPTHPCLSPISRLSPQSAFPASGVILPFIYPFLCATRDEKYNRHSSR